MNIYILRSFNLIPIMIFFLFSCSKEIEDPITYGNTITTHGLNFIPEVLNCNVGDTIFFELGQTHNAVEVSETNYNLKPEDGDKILKDFMSSSNHMNFFSNNQQKEYMENCYEEIQKYIE